MFDSPGVYYFEDTKTNVFNDDWLLDHNKISRLSSYKLVIANLSLEHYGIGGIDHVYHAFEQHGVNFLLLSHDPNDHFRLPKLLFYPHWYHRSRNRFKTRNHPSLDSYKRTHLIGCQNRNPRYHRLYNYLTLRNKSWFDSVFFTMHNQPFQRHRADDADLDDHMIEQWHSVKNNFPVDLDSVSGEESNSGILTGNTDAYINLVTETVMLPTVAVTEKIWRPIAAAQLFVAIGSQGVVEHLRTSGVDVFDDIIDHHHYDNETDWQKRIHCAHEILEWLMSQDLEKIYQQTHQRRLKNVEKFYSGEFDATRSLDYIQQCINMLN